MACCLIAAWLFGWVRSGISGLWHSATGVPKPVSRFRPPEPPIGTWSQQHPSPTDNSVTSNARRSRPRRWTSFGLVAALVGEIVLAVLLWHWWQIQAGRLMMHHSMPDSPNALVVMVVAGSEVALIVAARVWRQRRVLAAIAIAGLAVVVISTLLGVSAGSHVAAMAEMVLLTTVIPIALTVGTGRRMPGPDDDLTTSASTSARLRLILAVAAAAALVGSVFVWHLPVIHHAMNQQMVFVRNAGYLAVGMALWFLLTSGLRPGLPAKTCVLLLRLAYGGMGVVALAMIIGGQPLMPGMESTLPWSSLADQRAGGLIMMLGDTLLVLPVIAAASVASAAQQPGSDTTWLPQSAARREMELM